MSTIYDAVTPKTESEIKYLQLRTNYKSNQVSQQNVFYAFNVI